MFKAFFKGSLKLLSQTKRQDCAKDETDGWRVCNAACVSDGLKVRVCVLILVWLWDFMGCSPTGSSVCGIFQASGLPFPPPGDRPNPRIELESPVSLALAGGFFVTELPGSPGLEELSLKWERKALIDQGSKEIKQLEELCSEKNLGMVTGSWNWPKPSRFYKHCQKKKKKKKPPSVKCWRHKATLGPQCLHQQEADYEICLAPKRA